MYLQKRLHPSISVTTTPASIIRIGAHRATVVRKLVVSIRFCLLYSVLLYSSLYWKPAYKGLYVYCRGAITTGTVLLLSHRFTRPEAFKQGGDDGDCLGVGLVGGIKVLVFLWFPLTHTSLIVLT